MKDVKNTLAALNLGQRRAKAGLEVQTNNEQEAVTRLTEGEEQLRIEQAKLAGLEQNVDRLRRTLENAI